MFVTVQIQKHRKYNRNAEIHKKKKKKRKLLVKERSTVLKRSLNKKSLQDAQKNFRVYWNEVILPQIYLRRT